MSTQQIYYSFNEKIPQFTDNFHNKKDCNTSFQKIFEGLRDVLKNNGSF